MAACNPETTTIIVAHSTLFDLEMEEEFKVFLTKKEITADEYKGGSLEVKAKLVEAFALEKSKAQGKLSVQAI